MTLDNMTGITEGSYTGFCKSQLITCNRVKECNGVCPFDDALKHADKEMDEQNVIDHDREWIIGCIKHDGFIKTDRFDKANQIILDALSADAKTKCVAQIKVDTEEVDRVIEHLKKMPSELPSAEAGWIPCSERLPKEYAQYLVCLKSGECYVFWLKDSDWARGMAEKEGILAWMPLPKPYREDGE